MKIFIVDGTGDWSNAQYAEVMKDSFCHKIYLKLKEPTAYYVRGPSLSGVETQATAILIAYQVREYHHSMKHTAAKHRKIYLCGYSRGGAAVIEAARLLKLVNIEIEGMFLFDAVDRTIGLDASVISNNVKKVYHAIRDPKFTLDAKKKLNDSRMVRYGLMMDNFFHGDPLFLSLFGSSNHSADIEARKAIDRHYAKETKLKLKLTAGRSSGISDFGNCGMEIEKDNDKSERLIKKKFYGTHGALGGVFWKEIAGDKGHSSKVRDWMWAHLVAEKVIAQ